MRNASDLLGWVAGHIDQNVLGDDELARSGSRCKSIPASKRLLQRISFSRRLKAGPGIPALLFEEY